MIVTGGFPAIRAGTVYRGGILERTGSLGAQATPLTLLRAPRGWGKTVAALHWAEAQPRSLPVRWAAITEEGTPPWGELLAALGGAEPAPAGTRDRPSDEQLYARLSRTAAALDRPTTLIIDDWHRAASTRSDRMLTRLLALAPQLHLIVLSRYFAEMDSLVVGAEFEAEVIGRARLRFTEADTRALAERYGIRGAGVIREIQAATGGWPAAVRGVLARCGEGPDPDPGFLARAFAESTLQEMLEYGGADHRHHLAVHGCWGEGTGALLAERLGWAGERVREALVSAQLAGVGEHDPRTERLEVEPLLDDALRRHAEKSLDPPSHREARIAYAEWLIPRDPLGGARVLLEVGELRRLEQALQTSPCHPPGLAEMLGGEVVGLSEQQLQEAPFMLYLRTLAAQLEPHGASETILMWARRMLASAGPRTEDLLRSSLRVIAHRTLGIESTQAVDEQRAYEQRLRERAASDAPDARTWPHHFLTAGFTALLREGTQGADHWYALAEERALLEGSAPDRLQALSSRSMLAAVAGDLPEASELLRRATVTARQTGRTAPRLAEIDQAIARALIAAERCDGSRLAEYSAMVDAWLCRLEHWPLLVLAEGRLAHVRSGPHAALALMKRRVREARSALPSSDHLRNLLYTEVESLHVLTGRTDDPLAWHETDHAGTPRDRLLQARRALFSKDYLGALRSGQALFEQAMPRRMRCEASLLRAVTDWQLEARQTALEWFGEAIREMRAGELVTPLGFVPYPVLAELARSSTGSAGESEIGELPVTLRAMPRPPLTAAERRVLMAMWTHKGVRQVAESLFIAESTVKSHQRQIYRKLGVSGWSHALELATRLRLIEDGSVPR